MAPGACACADSGVGAQGCCARHAPRAAEQHHPAKIALVAGFTAAEHTVQVAGFRDAQAVIILVATVLQRDQDRLDGDLAHMIRRIAQEEPLLDAVEGDRFRGVNGYAEGFAGDAVNAGRSADASWRS